MSTDTNAAQHGRSTPSLVLGGWAEVSRDSDSSEEMDDDNHSETTLALRLCCHSDPNCCCSDRNNATAGQEAVEHNVSTAQLLCHTHTNVTYTCYPKCANPNRTLISGHLFLISVVALSPPSSTQAMAMAVDDASVVEVCTIDVSLHNVTLRHPLSMQSTPGPS